MGYTKAQKYGEEILATIYAFLESNNLLKLFPTFEPPTIAISMIWKDPLSDEATYLRSVSCSIDHQTRRMSSTQVPSMNNNGPFSTTIATTNTTTNNLNTIITNTNNNYYNNSNNNNNNTIQGGTNTKSSLLQQASRAPLEVNNDSTQYVMSSFQPSDYDEMYKNLTYNYDDPDDNNDHNNNSNNNNNNSLQANTSLENLSGSKRPISILDRPYDGNGGGSIDDVIFDQFIYPVSNKKINDNAPYIL